MFPYYYEYVGECVWGEILVRPVRSFFVKQTDAEQKRQTQLS